MNPLLVTMRGQNGFDVRNLSNFEAGIAFLTLLNRLSPGITFGKLARSMDAAGAGLMAGWWTDIKKSAGDIKDGIGDVLKDTWDTIGGGAGDAVRLVTDEKVIDGASRLGTAYATNGGSEGVRSVLDGLTGGGGGDASAVDKVMAFIASLGSSFKSKADGAGLNQAGMFSGAALPWLVGGGLVLFLVTGRRK
jgi:hypothetical protein